MENLKKYGIISIFISILLIFSMSHNVFATDVVPGNATLSGWNTSPQLNCWLYYGNTSVWSSWNPACSVGSGSAAVSVKAIQLRGANGGQIWANPGDILQIQIALTTLETQYQPQMYYLPNDSSSLQVISMKVDGSFTAKEGKELILTYYAKYVGNSANPASIQLGSAVSNARDIFSFNSNAYTLTGYSVSAWTTNIQNNDDVVSAIEDLSEKEEQRDEDIRNELEEGQDDLSDAGDNSTQAAETATSGFIDVINGLVTVITNASPTNCRINGNMGNLNIGNIDLCANPVPSFVTVIGSLLLILIIIPLCITLFNRFINLFRSFQN